MSGDRMRRALPLLFTLACLPLLAGCQYLFGGSLSAFDVGDSTSYPGLSFDAANLMPSPSNTWTHGRAQLTPAGAAPITLTLQSAAAYAEMGTWATWTDGTGWYVKLIGMTDVYPAPMSSGDQPWAIELDRIVGGRHFVASEPDCQISASQSTSAGITGTASCRAIGWADALADAPWARTSLAPADGLPSSVEITFAATP